MKIRIVSLTIVVALAVITGLAGFYFQVWTSPPIVATFTPSPTYQTSALCVENNIYTKEMGVYTTEVKTFTSTNEDRQRYCFIELWITSPLGVEFFAGSYGDIPYSFAIEGEWLTFTNAVAQIDGLSWYLLNLKTGEIRQQENYPFSD